MLAFQYFASTEATAEKAADSSVLSALGIDWKILVFQLIAFTLLVWLMSKYIFPVLIKAVDDRRALNEAGIKAAIEAEKNAAATEEKVAELLKKARKEAGEIVTTAKDEATEVVQKAEEKSRVHADRIVAEARESIDKEIVAAKKSLHNEMIDLVTAATEKVTAGTVTAQVDRKIVTDVLKESK